MAIAAFIGAALAATQPPHPYPAESVLHAFAEVCGDLRSMENAQKAAAEHTWVTFLPDANSEWAKRDYRKRGFAAPEGQVYQKKVSGQSLVLTLFRDRGLSDGTGKGVHCELDDFRADDGIPLKLITSLIGIPHESPRFDQPDMSKPGSWASWSPGLGPGTTQTLVSFGDAHQGIQMWSINENGW